MLKRIKKLKLQDVSGGFECELFNYGKMRDTIGHFNYEFIPGIYIIKGEFAMGGWALSEVLCGKDKTFTGEILADNQVLKCTDLKNISCYVGDELMVTRQGKIEKKTTSELIRYAVNHGLGFGKSADQIIEMFGLSEERMNRTIRQCSGERWRISMALGYAYQKQIYCFPWVNGKFLKSVICLQVCLRCLKEMGAIVIIPTTFPHMLDGIVDAYTVVDL